MSKKTAVLLLAALLAAGIGGAAVMYNDLKEAAENSGLAAAGSAQSSASSEKTEFQAAPDFPFRDGEGNEYHLTDFAGKPTIVNFWTSWCGPCQNEMPHFEEAYTTYGEEINFLMVNLTSLNIFVQEYQCPRISSSIGNICLGYIKLIPSQ